MEGDVGDDSVVQDSSSSVSPQPHTSSPCPKLNKLNCDNVSEEPTPGPSNSAADFDLEVSQSDSR